MKLALRELKFYKFKYVLVTLILFLLAFLVLFISALAQGLAKENASGVEAWNQEYFVISEGVDDSLTQSNIEEQLDRIEGITDEGHNIEFSANSLTTPESTIDAVFTNTDENIVPQADEGRLPENSDEILLNYKLTDEGYSIGDTVELEDTDVTFEITGFTDDIMYAHTSMAYVTDGGMERLDSTSIAAVALPENMSFISDDINDIQDVKMVSEDDIKQAIPSYQAEQQPLNLMIVFLFIISAIVLSAFFYVITIQKSSQIGILKAIGTKNSELVKAILIQVMLITLTGVVLSVVIMFALNNVIPVSMPFYLNTGLMVIVSGLFLVVAFLGAILSLVRIIKIDPLDAIGGE
ncbi:hemin ABC transporter permease [Salinicoccus sediminis]|uniref:Putative hemin transport system permease protein HrtB n=1 Tax=Salinicoccus sediminis TaxID=1432562 RepID=A0A0M2SGU0_9STAP|nr:ABC transporter permease [Salinicoccus sediminis]KKK33503.1 hemin ABC transporter permease [Salinicoccus sediminis]